MSESQARFPAGWGWPGNSRKAHYFEKGETVSICSRMMYAGERETGANQSPDNCAECKRRYQKAHKDG